MCVFLEVAVRKLGLVSSIFCDYLAKCGAGSTTSGAKMARQRTVAFMCWQKA